MKFRPDTTTSERQLAQALAASGRRIALGDLSSWRKDGLLPALASSGSGNGRTYYWREPDILAHARAAYDALRRYGRTDMTIVNLWLEGFRVPLAQLRRAWSYRSQLRKPLGIKSRAQGRHLFDTDAFGTDLPGMLLQTIASTGSVMDCEESPHLVVALLERALWKLGYASGNRSDGLAGHLWQALKVIARTLEESSLVRDASDEDMWKAQRYLRLVMRLLEDCRESEDWSEITQTLAPTLFLLLLTQLRAGRGAILEAAAIRLTSPDRRERPVPLYAHN